jgi:hypothetical protein
VLPTVYAWVEQRRASRSTALDATMARAVSTDWAAS